MYKVKLLLYEGKRFKMHGDNAKNDSYRSRSQEIADVSAGLNSQIFSYRKSEKIKVVEATESQQVFWGNELWDTLIERRVILTSPEPVTLTIEDNTISYQNGKSSSQRNALLFVDARKEEELDDEIWYVVNQSEIDYQLVAKDLSEKKQFETDLVQKTAIQNILNFNERKKQKKRA